MKTRNTRLGLLMALTLFVCCSLPAFAAAQQRDSVTNEVVHPRFVVLPKAIDPNMPTPEVTLQEWNGSYLDHNGNNHNFVMVGADPSTNQGALITTYVIPVKIILSTGEVFDPLSGGPFGAL